MSIIIVNFVVISINKIYLNFIYEFPRFLDQHFSKYLPFEYFYRIIIIIIIHFYFIIQIIISINYQFKFRMHLDFQFWIFILNKYFQTILC
jgi:hypothetical protein